MDRAEFVHWKKGIYLAQILEQFEKTIETHLPVDANGDVMSFKGLVRRNVKALERDAVEIFSLGDVEFNGVAQTMRHELSPTGRP